jgi:glycerol-3-phosphate dehydrogenase
LALGSGFPRAFWYGADDVVERFPGLNREQLLGAYAYWDAQMDNYALGMWASGKAKTSGVHIHEMTPVLKIDPEAGVVLTDDTNNSYDLIVNAAGPWAENLLTVSGGASKYRLDLIRGSHLVIPGKLEQGCVLQVAGEKRILFVLPHGENTLFGTTEVSQSDPDRCVASDEEIDYLIASYNRCFFKGIGRHDIISGFAGVRPIVASKSDFSAASRESVLERQGKLLNVFGGKWTTSRALAKAIVEHSKVLKRLWKSNLLI